MSQRHLAYAQSLAPSLLPSRADVLRALAAVADDAGNMALSLSQLAARTQWSIPTTKEALRELRQRGILTRDVQCSADYGYTANVYRFAALDAAERRPVRAPGRALVHAVNL